MGMVVTHGINFKLPDTVYWMMFSADATSCVCKFLPCCRILNYCYCSVDYHTTKFIMWTEFHGFFLCFQMFSFAVRALNSFRERLEEWPEYCYHILQVPHIHEAHDEIVDFVMNIVKASHTADPTAIIGDSHDPSVVALPTIVNAPTSILQDSQDEIYNSAFAAVDPAGNRFSSSQLRYPSGQVGIELCIYL
jgi:hypothetical protein